MPLPEYEPVRKPARQKIIELKRHRRISLGDHITLSFENRETLIHQIQEMMRAEHIYDTARIQEEIDTYNELIPLPGEISATLFIEITEKDRIKEILDRLQGIDSGDAVYLKIGGERIDGIFEAGHSKEDKLSAVHYVRFRLSEAQQKALADPSIAAEFIADHPDYHARADVSPETRTSILRDFSQ